MLEDRVQLGDTILGLSMVAFGLGSFDASLAVDPGTEDGGRHHGVLNLVMARSETVPQRDGTDATVVARSQTVLQGVTPSAIAPWEGYRADAAGSTTSADSGLSAPTNEAATSLAMPLSGSDDALARQLVFHRLTGSALVQSQGFPAGFGISSAADTAARVGGLPYAPVAPTEIGDSAGRSAQMFAAAGAASTLSFNAFTGQLAIRTDGGEHTVRESATGSGFIDVRLDGQDHSSDLSSPSFDRALAGVTSSTLAGIRFVGGGQDTLILGSQHLAGGFAVQATGATVLTENVTTAGPLAIQAPSVTVRGALQGSSVALAASGWVNLDVIGRIDAAPAASGGHIDVAAGVFVNSGQLHADGPSGGQISVQAGNILNAGPMTTNATDPSESGGHIHIAFTGSYVATTAAVISTSNEAGPGGQLVIDGGNAGRLYSSGRCLATGSIGGAVTLFGREVVLAGATVDASGDAGGGSVRIGGRANAQTVTVTPAGTVRADAMRTGSGGHVFVGADQNMVFDGTISARGGSAGGAGGFIEVSGHGDLSYGGSADAGAPSGKSGTLLLDPKNITIGDAPVGVFPQFDLIDPHPTAGGGFGTVVSALGNGNVVVTNPNDNFGGDNAGAVYLFNGLTGSLISSLVGSHSNEGVSGSVVRLSNGNYLVVNSFWNVGRGAVTWGDGTTGASGVVSDANSLIGSHPGDEVGDPFFYVTPLSNGNYVIVSDNWNGGRGAVTWGNGSTGTSGIVSDANSLVGCNPGDYVGGHIYPGGITALSNGNYVIRSLFWNRQRGAVTWGSGSTGISGTISDANSLIGSKPYDQIGYGGIIPLAHGNYVVASPYWNLNRGAATWGNGTTGISGTISDGNSLVGSKPGLPSGDINPGDLVGSSVIPLSNSNYVVPSGYGGRGAATWGNGTTGVTGTISEANSLVGTHPGDHVGAVTPLKNGNYVVRSPSWNGNRGAVTWGNGSTGISGTVSEANSLIGSNPDDRVGDYPGVALLTNGNYVVATPDWNGDRGAATWGNGSTGTTGIISDANSLVGSNADDYVGSSINPLSNGNYVIVSLYWHGGINNGRGAVTWGNGSTGTSGTVSDVNSLIGSDANDRVGSYGVALLSNSNYVVDSPFWNGVRGAVTWGNGSTGTVGIVSEANSLIGSRPSDEVGYSITPLRNGNYVIDSPLWNGVRGAVTWGHGDTGTTGVVSDTNSLVGGNAYDEVGYSGYGYQFVIPLSNGNYVVSSLLWGERRGAVTWGNGGRGTIGTVSAANSLVGNNPLDLVGGRSVHRPRHGELFLGNITPLSNGNYLVESPDWNGKQGAATWVSGSSGQTMDGLATITPQNSLLGSLPNAGLSYAIENPTPQSFLVVFATDPEGRVTAGLTEPSRLRYATAQSQSLTITPVFLTRTLNTGTAVVLQASNDITVNSPITVSAGGKGGALTLQAGRSILLNAPITTDNGALTLIANDRRTDGVVDSERDPGNAVITMTPGTAVDTGSGPFTVELRDGAGLTNSGSGAITLQTVSAGSVSVVNNGPSGGSDVDLGSVTTSGPQTYADPNGVTNVTGNLTATDNSITFTNSVVVSDGIVLNAGASTVNFAGSDTQTLQSGNGTSFVNLNHTGTGTLQLTSGLTVTGTFMNSAGTFDANNQAVTVAGPATVAGGIYLAGTAPQTFSGGLSITGSAFASSTGPMTVHGPIAVLGGELSAAGTVDTVTAIGGIVTPGGTSPGVLSVAGAVTFFASTTFSILCNGPTPGSDYSQLHATGPITLANSFLSLVLGLQPPVGSSFEILTNAGSVPITGRFSGLDEGTIFTQGGYQFQITYQGGTGGASVVLTRLV